MQSKRSCLKTVPESLLVTFKRFDANGRKIAGPVSGVREELELPSDYFLDGQGATYRLDGAVLHTGGTLASGHYTAFRRTIDSQGIHHYFYADDSQIRPIAQREFQDGIAIGNGETLGIKDAYLLFFRKIS